MFKFDHVSSIGDRIMGLTLITSCGCNLNCKYCHIAQGVNNDSARLQKETIAALQDGSFIENTKQVLYKLGSSPDKITTISFWGQEPTLTLHYITEHISEWVEIFPKWESLMFSTNGMDFADRIVDFVIQLDNALTHSFKFDIQVSYDGETSTDNIRQGNSAKIWNTVSYIITELNKIKLNHVNLSIVSHGVVSLELLRRLDTYEKIEKYLIDLNAWGAEAATLNTNNQVFVDSVVGLALENPVDATTADGLRLTNFLKYGFKVNPKAFKYPEIFEYSINTIIQQYRMQMDMFLRPFNCNNVEELLNLALQSPEKYQQIMYFMSEMLYCSNSYGELKLMYDGTIINCQNSIYDRDEKFLPPEDGDLKNQVIRSLAKHKYYINPLVDDDYTIKKHFEMFRVSKEYSFSFIFNTTTILMEALLKAHQIDESYKDLNKLLAHSFLLSFYNCCQYNNYVKTGSMYLRSTGFIRLFANGLLDFICSGNRAWEADTYEK